MYEDDKEKKPDTDFDEVHQDILKIESYPDKNIVKKYYKDGRVVTEVTFKCKH